MKKELNYKYSIFINQKTYMELEIKISFELGALLYYLIKLCESESEKIEEQRNNGYTWVNYTKILKDMPLLKGRTGASITNKLNQLEKLGFLKTKIVTNVGRPRKYIKTTELCLSISDGLSKDYDKECYGQLINLGMSERRAMTIASTPKFWEDKKATLKRAIQSSRIENKAGYIYKVFLDWTVNVF